MTALPFIQASKQLLMFQQMINQKVPCVGICPFSQETMRNSISSMWKAAARHGRKGKSKHPSDLWVLQCYPALPTLQLC